MKNIINLLKAVQQYSHECHRGVHTQKISMDNPVMAWISHDSWNDFVWALRPFIDNTHERQLFVDVQLCDMCINISKVINNYTDEDIDLSVFEDKK